jgi:hypothetical protein
MIPASSILETHLDPWHTGWPVHHVGPNALDGGTTMVLGWFVMEKLAGLVFDSVSSRTRAYEARLDRYWAKQAFIAPRR